MNGKRSFAIVGGDLRNIKLGELLSDEGFSVKLYGFEGVEINQKELKAESLKEAVDDADVVVGPIPCSQDDQTLHCAYFEDRIFINELFRQMNKNQIFIAGMINDRIKHMAEAFNVYWADILDREEMAVLNAIPTAEGAIQLAMEELPITLHNSNILVMGFGRIGKILAKMLNGIGARVYVEARKHSDIAWIESYGYTPIHLSDLYDHLGNFDIIYNTIPYIVLDTPELDRVRRDCLLIDLASKPGGINFQKAKEMGRKCIWALSLPGKVAPATAARFVKNTVFNIINDLGL